MKLRVLATLLGASVVLSSCADSTPTQARPDGPRMDCRNGGTFGSGNRCDDAPNDTSATDNAMALPRDTTSIELQDKL